MNPEVFRQTLAEQGLPLTDQQMAQFAQYYQLLITWNERMNLTNITERDEVYLKHFYDSLTPMLGYDFQQKGGTICDIGAGAGFPSLPLKIVFPELKVTIVDSLNKRILFLEELVAELGLTDVALYHERAENLGRNPEFRERFSVVTARAVARLAVLAEFCLPLTAVGGTFIALKAAKGETELAEATNALHLLGGTLTKKVDLHLPETQDSRQLLFIQKTQATPKRYPRKPGIPAKQPLA